MRRAFVTGTAGFIGFHLARHLLAAGWQVHGFDAFTDYYDVALKEARQDILEREQGFGATRGRLEDDAALSRAVAEFAPDVIVHLAAQAGVRYSIEAPRAYLDANIVGTFNVLEAARRAGVGHLLIASTSSVYGANTEMPYAETDKADTPLSFYAATKKATEAMAHAQAHIHDLPVTMFRFFTVYGPWGRPDMAPSRFADAILAGRPIDLYNHGEMWRDFTYIDDLVAGIAALIDAVPARPADPSEIAEGDPRAPVPGDSLSPVAPFRIVNIGHSESVKLLDFVAAMEEALGVAAERNLMDIQPGDVRATWADATLLHALVGDLPKTPLAEGVARFAAWFRDYHGR